MRWTIRLLTRGLASGGFLTLLSGCAGGDAAGDLGRMPAGESLKQRPEAVWRFPADREFSIARSPASFDPGLEGEATADAQASTNGEARAEASAGDGGSADALFQIGHAFSNDSEQQIDLEVRAQLEYEVALTSTGEGPPNDAATLRIYARDDRKRNLAAFNIASNDVTHGDVQSSGNRSVRFTVTLGPGRTVAVFAAGTVKVSTEQDQRAGATLAVRNLTLEVRSTAAPMVGMASE